MRHDRLTVLAALLLVAGCGHGHEHAEEAPAPNAAAAVEHDDLHAHQHAGEADDATCTCATARLANGWCGAHGIGYVAGVLIPSADLYEVLDAHGHEIDHGTLQCADCLDAVATDGYCATHGFGFVDGQLYVSRLTWVVGRGQPRDPATITCETCRVHTAMPGWCDSCNVGMAGTVAYEDRALFDVAAAEMDRLVRAVGTLPRCELCAIRHFANGPCTACGLVWTNGQSAPISN